MTAKNNSCEGIPRCFAIRAAILAAVLMLIALGSAVSTAYADGYSEYEIDGYTYYVEWGDEYGEGLAFLYCNYCSEGDGREFTDGEHEDAAAEILAEFFCADCDHCANCWEEYHCAICKKCFETGDAESCPYCNSMICLDCHEDTYFCDICGNCRLEDGATGLSLTGHESVGLPNLGPVCGQCLDEAEECTNCPNIISIGSYVTYEESGDPWCPNCRLCRECVADFAACADYGHCMNCGVCGDEADVCGECGWCENCRVGETHCPLCNDCFGDDIEWCPDNGEHCVHCDEDNDWICPACHECMEVTGGDICPDCGLCEECCALLSEIAGCCHGYCIASSEYEEHLCPECGGCPEDLECEYCLLCENCQSGYHCEHDICPDNEDEWEEHLCDSCGDCFNLNELCEYCHMCDSCNDHCEHDICPESSEYDDHICEWCGDCFEQDEFCETCGLCENCCEDNALYMGCSHGLCIESDEFQQHYCFTDEQCLQYCAHYNCLHSMINTTWSANHASHWNECKDCGMSVNSAVHTPGSVIVVKQPNSMTRTNGYARVYCEVCEEFMRTESIPYVEIPPDGSPYILSQPKDYHGKTTISGEQRYAAFTVMAGGQGLSYQWYESWDGGPFQALSDSDNGYGEGYWGTKTSSLRVYIEPSACYEKYQYYCVVTNAKGSARTRTASINAEHIYDYNYIDDDTHILHCLADGCEATKGEPERHSWNDVEIIRPATTTQTGLAQQMCMECYYTHQEGIARLAENHVHAFTYPRKTSEVHWWQCACGEKSGIAAHELGGYWITVEPTEFREGQRKRKCNNCDYIATEPVGKLPHSHDFTTLSDARSGPYSPYNGRIDKNYHVRNCYTKGCPAEYKELHSYNSWRIVRSPKTVNGVYTPGYAYHWCLVCGHGEGREYDAQWPILTEVMGQLTIDGFGGANISGPVAANTGEKVTLTVTLAEGFTCRDTSSMHGWSLNEVTNIEGMTVNGVWVSYQNQNITDFKANATTFTATFTMPAGPVALAFFPCKCDHRNTGTYDDVVPASCAVSGANVKRCSSCHTIVETLSRIEPPGHVLSATPIPGTTIVEYCSITRASSGTGYTTTHNTEKYGYSGDFLCTVCGETVKGERTPLVHGRQDKAHLVPHDPGQIMTGRTHMPDEGENGCPTDPTCISAGYTGDICCSFCGERIQKGERIEPEGHDWSDWEVIREATPKIKEQSMRVCDSCGKEQYKTGDYSGPDYALKADRMKISFNITYGEEPQPATVTFTSVGRDPVTTLDGYEFVAIGDMMDVALDGMTMTLTPRPERMIVGMADSSDIEVIRLTKVNGNVRDDEFTAPEIVITANVRKTAAKYTMTVEGGKAYTDGANQRYASTTLKARGGECIHLVADYPEFFYYWAVEGDQSGLLEDNFYWMERSNDTHLITWMCPSDVEVTAVYDFTGNAGQNAYYTFNPDDRSLTITGTGEMFDFDYNDCPWMDKRDAINSVTIGDGITYIGNYAFYQCSQIRSVTIPDSVMSIGDFAFTDCRALTAINVGSGNTAYTSPDGVLYNKSMTELITYPAGKWGNFTVPDGVKMICSRAFEGAARLYEVTIPDSVTSINGRAFKNCSALRKVIIMGMQVYISRDEVFENTSPDLAICGYANSTAQTFANNYLIPFHAITEGTCGNTLNWILIGDTLKITKNGPGAGSMTNYSDTDSPSPFQGNNSIRTVIIGEGVGSIGNYAFYGCENLLYLDLPSTLSVIGTYAFGGCTRMYSPDLEETCVQVIRDHAFDGCTGIEWIVIPEGVRAINAYVFADCTYLAEVSLPSTLTEIGYSAFSHTALTSIDIPDSVTKIGGSAFSTCTELTGEICLPESLTMIYDTAFYNCDRITSVRIPSGVTSIGAGAFKYCASLSDVVICNPSVAIGNDAFAHCSESLTIRGAEGSTAQAYAQTNNIAFVALATSGRCGPYVNWSIEGNTLTVSGSGRMYDYSLNNGPAFRNHPMVVHIVIEEGVNYIGQNAFYRCGPVVSISLPDSVTSVGNNAFADCTALKTVNIPPSLFSIGYGMLDGCTSLTEVTLSESTTSIGAVAFRNCAALKKISIPTGVTEIHETAFQGCTALTIYGYPCSCAAAFAADNGIPFVALAPEPAFFLPAALTSIENEAFSGIGAVAVVIPNTVTSITDNPFAGSDVTTIYGYADSAAEVFARDNGFTFVKINDAWMAGQ